MLNAPQPATRPEPVVAGIARRARTAPEWLPGGRGASWPDYMASKVRIPFRVKPMLATLVDKPFHRPGWTYEEKYDGYRILAYKEGAKVTLRSRNDKDRTATFPEVAKAIGTQRSTTLLLDGEVVAFDRNRISRFQLLQQGGQKPMYAAFDCLFVDGIDLRKEPQERRRSALIAVLRPSRHLFVARRLAANGLTAYRRAQQRGYEGVLAKDARSPYVQGRSRAWLKVKVHAEEEFVIGGFSPPAGSRTHFGALFLGAYAGDQLHYVGKVGTGFSRSTLASLRQRFQPLRRKTSPFVDPPRATNAVWLAPKLVAQVAFQEWTGDRRLRQPVFLGLRNDKAPEECLLPDGQLARKKT